MKTGVRALCMYLLFFSHFSFQLKILDNRTMYFMSVEIVLFYFIVRLYRKNNATIVQCAPACPQSCRKLGVVGGVMPSPPRF